MFAVEVIAGLAAGSAALQADALDFLGDAANYAISLLVVGMALRYRALATLAKGATMVAFGLVGHRNSGLARTPRHGTLPSAFTMGTVGVAALTAMPRRSVCFGPIVTATPTCVPHGFAPGTMSSAIWRSYWPRSACSAPKADGPTRRGSDYGGASYPRRGACDPAGQRRIAGGQASNCRVSNWTL